MLQIANRLLVFIMMIFLIIYDKKKSFGVLSGCYLVAGVCVEQQRSNTEAKEIFLSELKVSACNKQLNIQRWKPTYSVFYRLLLVSLSFSRALVAVIVNPGMISLSSCLSRQCLLSHVRHMLETRLPFHM